MANNKKRIEIILPQNDEAFSNNMELCVLCCERNKIKYRMAGNLNCQIH